MTPHQDALLLETAPIAGARWRDQPTHKARAGVQRAVTRLLDALAPERTVVRTARPPRPVERHRTPHGCILQAPAAAMSVSWFPDAASDAASGELQVLVWRGVVSRPGSAHRAPAGATVARALVLRPEEGGARADGLAPPEDAADNAADDAADGTEASGVAIAWGWRAGDGTRYETDALAAHCLALLEQQVAGAVLTGASG